MVLATFLPVIKLNKKDNIVLEIIQCIYYSIWLKKNEVQAFFNLNNEVNKIILVFAFKLGPKVWYANIGAQKIDNSTFEIFEIILTSFRIKDKLGKAYFFQELLLLANTNIEVMLKMFFLIFNNTNIWFTEKKLFRDFTWQPKSCLSPNKYNLLIKKIC